MELNLAKEKNKLESYLDDIYEKESVFQIEQEEVEFIQIGIETLAQTAVDLLQEYFDGQKPVNSENALTFYRFLRLRGENKCPKDLIKVGSFYEGTKNNFPGEFDFIFLLFYTESSLYYGTDGTNIPKYGSFRDHLMGATLFFKQVVEDNQDKFQYSSSNGKRKIYVDKFVDIHGPAANFQFIYQSDLSEKKEINVDFVPAIKVTGEKLPETLGEICHLKEFHKEILSTGGYLFVGSGGRGVTFTETEVHFMKNVLSPNHVKVYRILKFLINGDGDGEKVEEYLRTRRCKDERIYSSYLIKSMMIYHHYECVYTDASDIGPCLLHILDSMSSYRTVQDFPQIVYKAEAIQFRTILKLCKTMSGKKEEIKQTIYGDENLKFPIPLLPYLQCMTRHLRSMQCSGCGSDYQMDKMKKSVSKMFLDDHPTRELKLHDDDQSTDSEVNEDQSTDLEDDADQSTDSNDTEDQSVESRTVIQNDNQQSTESREIITNDEEPSREPKEVMSTESEEIILYERKNSNK